MGEDADVASVLGLRQQIVEHWPEGDRKNAVLKAVDDLLRSAREKRQAAATGDANPRAPHR